MVEKTEGCLFFFLKKKKGDPYVQYLSPSEQMRISWSKVIPTAIKKKKKKELLDVQNENCVIKIQSNTEKKIEYVYRYFFFQQKQVLKIRYDRSFFDCFHFGISIFPYPQQPVGEE